MNNSIDDFANDLHDSRSSLAKRAKNRIFDIIAVGLVLCVGLLNLGAIGLRPITMWEILDMLLESVPFYISSVILALDFYKKGVYSGKKVEAFSTAVKNYSHKVNKLSGRQLDNLSDFCTEYNDKARKICRENLLRGVAISYNRYINTTEDSNGNKIKPLCQMSKKELEDGYGERVAQYVIKANNLKIKGLNASTLLCNSDNWDITDLGQNEQQLFKRQTKSYAGTFAVSTLLLTLMTIKDIMTWGWVSFILVAFKLIFILCRCYFEYFKGYEDITIRVVNHLSRKTDVLKQYDYWYYVKYPSEFDLTDPDYAYLGNIS